MSLSYTLCEMRAMLTSSHWVAEMMHLNAQLREPDSVHTLPTVAEEVKVSSQLPW